MSIFRKDLLNYKMNMRTYVKIFKKKKVFYFNNNSK